MPAYRLTSELNRECLPSSERDPNRKVAWMNAVCVFVLAIGVIMTKEPAQLAFTPEVYQPPQPIELVKAAEPETLPEIEDLKPEDIPDFQESQQVQAVVVVAPDASAVPFAVPVVGATLVSTDLRQVSPPPKLQFVTKAPPAPAVFNLRPSERANYGDLPWPTDRDYPPEAKTRRETGDVIMVIDVDAAGGAPREVTIERSSGSSYLDNHAREWVRTRWKFNPLGERKRLRSMFSYSLGL